MRVICLLKPTLLENENNPGRNHFSWSFETQHAWNFPHLRKKEFSINDSIMVRWIHPPMKCKLENYLEKGLNRQEKNAYSKNLLKINSIPQRGPPEIHHEQEETRNITEVN